VTAGIGGAKANYAYSASFNEGGLMPVISSCFCTSTAGNVGISPTGIVFGAGAEWKIWPQVVIGAEYLHYALYSDTALPLNTATLYSHGPFVGGFVGPGLGDHIHTNSVDVIRVRASYLFNWWNR
jgi:opacity protein-like surface antigen